jgi:hypothetical protein
MSSKRFLCCSFSCCFDVFVICNNPGTSNAVPCACFFCFHPPTLRPSPACSTWDSGLLLIGAHPHSRSGGGPTPTISWEQTCRKTGSIAQEGERGQSPRSPGIAGFRAILVLASACVGVDLCLGVDRPSKDTFFPQHYAGFAKLVSLHFHLLFCLSLLSFNPLWV